MPLRERPAHGGGDFAAGHPGWKGIEVNTSGYRYGLADGSPNREILRLYRELGRTILTIGSDGHAPQELGAHIEQAHAALHTLGFERYCTYCRMKPCFHAL